MISYLRRIWNGMLNFINLELYYLRKRIRAKYYVIVRSEGGAGFFSNYFWVLGHVVFAKKLGYIPVVDMQNYPTLYSEKEPVNGTRNAWNYYFENVGAVDLEEVYASQRYVMGRDKYLTKYAEKYSMSLYRFPSDRMIQYYTPFIKEFLQIKPELLDEYEREWKEKIVGEGQVLGIHVRGTDMKNNLGHPMPAPISRYLQETKKMLKKYPSIRYIFLATDENNVKEAYEKEFEKSGVALVVNDAFRVWDTDIKRKTGLHELHIEHPRPFHKYLLGKEVLRDAWFLKMSHYLICGHSNISNVAILWNEGKYTEIVCVDTV